MARIDTTAEIDAIRLAEAAAPATPASGYAKIYVSTTGILHYINDAGDDYDLTEARGAAASIADGGTIAHGMGVTPTGAICSPSVAGEMVSVTGLDGTNITVAIKQDDGTAGTSQTIYWMAWI